MNVHATFNKQPSEDNYLLSSTNDRTYKDKIYAYSIYENEKYIYAKFGVKVETRTDDFVLITLGGAYYSKDRKKWYTPKLPKRENDKYSFSAWYTDPVFYYTIFPELPLE